MKDAEAAALLGENAELRSQVSCLTEQLVELNERVGELVAVAQRRQGNAPVEKPPMAPPAVDAETRQSFEQRPQPPPKPERKRVTGPRPKPTGRRPLPSQLEVENHLAQACGV